MISELLVAGSSWPRTFFTPQVFLFSISLLFVNIIYYFIAKYIIIIVTNLKICVILYRKKLQEGTNKMHGLASHFVYVATIVLVYVCVSLFL